MKQNETASPSVNLFPLFAISVLTLLGVIAAVIMLFGLHGKIQKPVMTDAVIAADEIGQIELDKDLVRINLMTRTDTGGLEKSQQVTIPLAQFASGYPRLNAFMDQMIEQGIINKKDEE